MLVDPINYQASSRYEKSETTTMKLLLLFMFVAVAVATEEPNTVIAKTFAIVFHITQEQVLECIKKTGVTIEDVKRMVDSMEHSESVITDMKSVKTASCALVCSAQKQGTVVGKEIQLDEIFNNFLETGAPEDIQETLRACVRFCKDQAADTEDQCMMFYRFTKCMHLRIRRVLGEK